MKKIPKTIWVALISLGLGLVLGGVFFGSSAEPNHDQLSSDLGAETNNSTWTCAMHPQIRSKEPGTCPICAMDLTPVATGTGNDDPARLEMTPQAVKLANIQTRVLGPEQVSVEEISLNGTFSLDESRLQRQTAHVRGRIEKLYVSTTGEKVTKGQKLIRFYAPALVDAQRELLEAKKYKDSNPALWEASQQKLKSFKLSDEQIDEITRKGEVKPTMDLYAEASGLVIRRNVATGDYVSAGDVLLEVASLDRLWGEFEVYEKDLESVQVGDRVHFEVMGKQYDRAITYMDPLINPQTRVVIARVEVPNRGGALKPDMFVKGFLRPKPNKRGPESLMLPRSAVLWTGRRSLVYVKVSDKEVPTFEAREVVLGKAIGQHYVLESGLSAGEEIVIHGTFMVDAAAQLNNKRSMMNLEVNIKGQGSTEEEISVPDFSASSPLNFKQGLQTILEEYLLLKDALVQSRIKEALLKSEFIAGEVQKLSPKDLPGEAKVLWQETQGNVDTGWDKSGKDPSLEDLRSFFFILSNELIYSAKAFGVTSSLYVQYCPMANEDQGAFWLSSEEEILNPYFGDKMLHCGWVEDTLLSQD